MRFIIYGVGAIGGTVAAQLTLSGHEVIGIARGAHLAALRDKGLLFRTPAGTVQVRFDCAGSPGEVAFEAGDVVFMAIKSQHTEAALVALRDRAGREIPLFCLQNGVANERMAQRYFTHVHGVCVMLPASHDTPGEINAFGQPNQGIFDIGRFPAGTDALDETVAGILSGSGIASTPLEDVMDSKYGKLLLNLNNIIVAAMGSGDEADAWYGHALAEGKRALETAGIGYRDMGADPRREHLMQDREIEGVRRIGSSSLQSIVRGADSVETDYLNGEISLLGRLHGVDTPVNDAFCDIARALVAGRMAPGEVTADMIEKPIQIL